MEENKNSEEESMMTPSEFLDVKLEPVVSDYIPSSGAFLGSNQDYPVLDLMSNTQPTNVDAENDREETIYDIANLSPIVTIKEEPIDNGNFSPDENEHESENMNFVKPVENLDGNKSISRMNKRDHHVYFDENVCIKEELEVIEEIPEDINSLDNSQDSHDERDFKNQKNAENVVYIKEEGSGIGEENTTESSAPENIQEDNSFGQHFLTSFFPSVVKYECSNDQMIDEEFSTSQHTQPITQNQALPDPIKLYSPAYTTENTNKDQLMDLVDVIVIQDLSDIAGFSDDDDGDPSYLTNVRELGCDDSSDSDHSQLALKPVQTKRDQFRITDLQPGTSNSLPQSPTTPVSSLGESTPNSNPERPFRCCKNWAPSGNFNPVPAAPYLEVPIRDDRITTPLNAFLRYVSEEVIEEMAMATTQQILSNTDKQFIVTPQILKQFIGINIVMSYLKYPRTQMYWARKTRVSQIADVMTRNKFYLIRNNLTCRNYCAVSQEEKDGNKFWKIEPILTSIKNACLVNPRPQRVSMDEQTIPFHGRAIMRQYVKGNPNPFGIKYFVSAAPDGLPLDFFLYQGKADSIKEADPKLEFDLGGKVVLKLAETLPEGSFIYMDEHFNSISLMDELFSLRLHATGPVQMSRISMECDFCSDSQLRSRGRGSYEQLVRDDGQISLIKWLDDNIVVIASNAHGAQPEDVITRWSKTEQMFVSVRRPNVITQYNENMGGIDLLNRTVAFYRIPAKTKKWTVRVIFHFIDFSLAASWIEMRRAEELQMTPKHKRLDFLDFKVKAAYELLNCEKSREDSDNEDANDMDSDNPSEPPPQKKRKIIPLPTDSARTYGAVHLPEIPLDAKLSRCRLPGCNNQKCRFWCVACKIFLCLNNNRNCFKIFHEL